MRHAVPWQCMFALRVYATITMVAYQAYDCINEMQNRATKLQVLINLYQKPINSWLKPVLQNLFSTAAIS
jgi:hypothetical protein